MNTKTQAVLTTGGTILLLVLLGGLIYLFPNSLLALLVICMTITVGMMVYALYKIFFILLGGEDNW